MTLRAAGIAAAIAAASLVREAGAARVFHVDDAGGDDRRSGLAPADAWQSLDRVNLAELEPGDRVVFRRGGTWRGQLVPHSGAADAPVAYGAYGRGPKPRLLGSVALNSPDDWEPAGPGLWRTARSERRAPLDVDVGNIIFDDGAATGVKRWSAAELVAENDYWYDDASRSVLLRCSTNPAAAHRSIELALRRHIIDQGGRSFVTYEDLALAYGAAHGIGGGSTRGIAVRRCDLSYIGGGHQLTRTDGVPVRFGNGIEFWSGARDSRVEECRIWEIYDAALTNQGDGTNTQENIVYRRNVIWNSEYSFEYWNRGADSVTRNIVFEHNTCVDAGCGWGHSQRPDPNGRHLMFYSNTARTSGFVVRGNIFARSADSLLRLHGVDWTSALAMDGNLWWQPAGEGLWWGTNRVAASDLPAFLRARGFDTHSLFAEPHFVDASARDYRPVQGDACSAYGAVAQ